MNQSFKDYAQLLGKDTLELNLDAQSLDLICRIITAQIISYTHKHDSMSYYSSLRPYNNTTNNLKLDGTEEIPYATPNSIRPYDFVNDMKVLIEETKELIKTNTDTEEKMVIFLALLTKLLLLFSSHFNHSNNVYFSGGDLEIISQRVHLTIVDIAKHYSDKDFEC